MNIEIIGVGRAGGAIAVAAHRSGHRIVGLEGRSPVWLDAVADLVPLAEGEPALRIIAVRDDAIADVARSLSGSTAVPTVHLSGSVSTDALAPIRADGAPVGSFHPLQTLPDPVAGADRLPGSWIAITSDDELREPLSELARSFGARPFTITDDHKPLYHAAAAATANYTLAALAVARRLYEEAGVPFEASRPLIEAIVDNAYAMGPQEALTGPIARGDAGTVRIQREAVASVDEALEAAFVHLGLGTAVVADADEAIFEALA